MRTHPLALALTLSLVGCGDKGDSGEELNCDTMAAVSVSVTLVNPDGVAVTDAEVTWATADQSGACDFMVDAFLCGYEVAGDITITAVADGFADASETVTVEQGECHVVQESIQMTLALAEG